MAQTACPEYDVPSSRVELLDATLTPERSNNVRGYGTSYGALSPRSFTVGSTTWTIFSVYERISSPADKLDIRLTANIPSDVREVLQLHVCDETYSFSDIESTQGTGWYRWNDPDIDWSSPSTRSLKITVPHPNPVFSRPSQARGPLAPDNAPGARWVFGQPLHAHAPGGARVGWPVTATDPYGGDVTYALAGRDGSKFRIDDEGQIWTVDGEDYRPGTYLVDVVATEPDDETATARLAIPVRQLAGVPPDRAGAPELIPGESRVRADGRGIELHFDEHLSAWWSNHIGDWPEDNVNRFRPTPEMFLATATGAGGPVEFEYVAVRGNVAYLMGASPRINEDATVFVSYAPGRYEGDRPPLQDWYGEEVAAFTGVAVKNWSYHGGRASATPAILDAWATPGSPGRVNLDFDRALQSANFPPASVFDLKFRGVGQTIASAARHSSIATRVLLTLDSGTAGSNFASDWTVSYEASGTDSLTGTNGEEARDFEELPVKKRFDVSVNSPTVREGTDATADFTVRLPGGTLANDVRIDYRTENRSARGAGAPGPMPPGNDRYADYRRTAGTLTFAPGDREETVRVPIYDNNVEDSGQTFVLVLSNLRGIPESFTVTLPEGRATILNHESGAQALTAAFSEVPESHGGETFAFRLAFSEDVPGLGWRALRDDALAAAGGTVLNVNRVARGSNRAWTVTVAPDGAGPVTVTLPATADCEAAGAICVDARPLAAAATATVPGAAETVETGDAPFTVRLAEVPAEHDGESAVSFEVHFSDEPHGYSYRTLRDATLGVSQGGTRITPSVKRLEKASNRAWTVTVEPVSKADIAIAVAAPADCAAAGAVCNADGEPLAGAVSATVPGPPALSVADARAREAPGATLDFAVTMSRASAATVTVDYATSDGTATAGADYEATSGTLSFAPGETEKTVSVPVHDDAHEDGGETLALTLSDPSGGNAYLADSEAVGTIENADAMPSAWLARFGRTVASQAVEAVEARLAAARAPGVEMRLAGERIGGRAEDAEGDPGSGSGASGLAAMADWLRGVEDGGRSRAVTPRQLLTGSSFALTGEARGGGTVGLWGRGAVTRFDGREGDLALDGEVASAMLGADWSGGRWTAGVMVSRSLGEGGWRGAGSLGHGRQHADRAVPLRPLRCQRPGDGVGARGLRRGRAHADARRPGGDAHRHGPADGRGGPARRRRPGRAPAAAWSLR